MSFAETPCTRQYSGPICENALPGKAIAEAIAINADARDAGICRVAGVRVETDIITYKSTFGGSNCNTDPPKGFTAYQACTRFSGGNHIGSPSLMPV